MENIEKSSPASTPIKVVIWGTYDTGKPRTRILVSGLRENGVEVTEIHKDIWSGVEDKSQITTWSRIWFLLRWSAAYPMLIIRYLRAPKHDVVLIPYMGQLDVLVLWIFARLRRVPIVWDMFISLYDTVVLDRKMVKKDGFGSKLIWAVERLSCKLVARILMDTGPHARNVEEIFSLKSGYVDWVPVGVEPNAFPRLHEKITSPSRPKILFYGQMIPLHGVETILSAASDPRGAAFDWHLVGKGQHAYLVEQFLENHPLDNVTSEEWVKYDQLVKRIEQCDVCLGIFGNSKKAACVVPNKVYQAISAGRAIITRDSKAMRDLLNGSDPGVVLIAPQDPDALLDAIEALTKSGFPQPSLALLEQIQPAHIGQRLSSILQDVTTPLG